MAHPWKVGDQVFYRPVGEMQCSAHTITHIWTDKNPPVAYLDNGDVIPLTNDTLTPPPAAQPEADDAALARALNRLANDRP